MKDIGNIAEIRQRYEMLEHGQFGEIVIASLVECARVNELSFHFSHYELVLFLADQARRMTISPVPGMAVVSYSRNITTKRKTYIERYDVERVPENALKSILPTYLDRLFEEAPETETAP